MGALAHKLEDVGSSAVGTVRNPSLLRYCTTALVHYCATALVHYCISSALLR